MSRLVAARCCGIGGGDSIAVTIAQKVSRKANPILVSVQPCWLNPPSSIAPEIPSVLAPTDSCDHVISTDIFPEPSVLIGMELIEVVPRAYA